MGARSRGRFVGGAVDSGQCIGLALQFGGEVGREELLHFAAEGVLVGMQVWFQLRCHVSLLNLRRSAYRKLYAYGNTLGHA